MTMISKTEEEDSIAAPKFTDLSSTLGSLSSISSITSVSSLQDDETPAPHFKRIVNQNHSEIAFNSYDSKFGQSNRPAIGSSTTSEYQKNGENSPKPQQPSTEQLRRQKDKLANAFGLKVPADQLWKEMLSHLTLQSADQLRQRIRTQVQQAALLAQSTSPSQLKSKRY